MYGILIREGKTTGDIKNIGDFVQSIAQKQFIKDKETRYVEIEELSSIESDEQVNVIMNGWFMHKPEEFPPAQCINPLFISFHLTPPKEKDFFTPQTINYLKKYQPIGARDYQTVEIMERHGIQAYMSGCLTLTLGKEYGGQTHDGKYLIVDPYIELGGDLRMSLTKQLFKTLYWGIKYFMKAYKLQHKYIYQHTLGAKLPKNISRFLEAATFYAIYSERFADEILLNADFKSVIVDNHLSIEKKFELADSMLREYSKAKFVITSRLHVAFPCLAMNTNNVFVVPSQENEDKIVNRYTGRLKGLEDTVTILELNKGKIVNTQANPNIPSKISVNNIPENKLGYKKYSDLLLGKVSNFIRLNQE